LFHLTDWVNTSDRIQPGDPFRVRNSNCLLKLSCGKWPVQRGYFKSPATGNKIMILADQLPADC
jgi:hypothetical protein